MAAECAASLSMWKVLVPSGFTSTQRSGAAGGHFFVQTTATEEVGNIANHEPCRSGAAADAAPFVVTATPTATPRPTVAPKSSALELRWSELSSGASVRRRPRGGLARWIVRGAGRGRGGGLRPRAGRRVLPTQRLRHRVRGTAKRSLRTPSRAAPSGCWRRICRGGLRASLPDERRRLLPLCAFDRYGMSSGPCTGSRAATPPSMEASAATGSAVRRRGSGLSLPRAPRHTAEKVAHEECWPHCHFSVSCLGLVSTVGADPQ